MNVALLKLAHKQLFESPDEAEFVFTPSFNSRQHIQVKLKCRPFEISSQTIIGIP